MVAHAKKPTRAKPAASFWLDQLKEAHRDLLNAIHQLAVLTAGPVPDKAELTDIRWRVSQASLARRLLWGRILALLARRVDPSAERDLRRLQDVDARLIRASAAHVGKWTANTIIEDWPGYCQASKLMRRKMIDAMAEEKRLLYPILNTFNRD